MEALIGLKIQIEAVHRLLIAHDLGKNLEPEFLIKEEKSFARSGILVCFRQEIKEFSCLNLGVSLSHEYLEHLLHMEEVESDRPRINNDELDKIEKYLHVVLVRDAL